MASSAREIAARVLERVERDRAFAAAALAAELERAAGIDPRERALATELVYGSLRTRSVLLEELARGAPRGLSKLDPRVRAELLIAAYQITLLERVPAHAAVDAAVGAIKRARGPRLAGFANALLRRLAASEKRLDRSRAILDSTPRWLLDALERSVGRAEAHALLGAGESALPAVSVRLRSQDDAPLPELLERAPEGRVSPLARILTGAGDPHAIEGWEQGRFVVQEEGSQLVALAVGARPGERVLDACAGRGQKTSLLAERVGPSGRVWAADAYPEKLAQLERELERLRLPKPETAAVDWTVGCGPVPEGFDRVLVDAPCTGTGTLRRRPEIGMRLQPDDPERLSAIAESILRRAATRAAPHGRVIFSVCSVLREECEELIERVSDVLEPQPFDAPELAGIVDPAAASFRLLPLAHGTDGYFVASFVQRTR